MARFRTETTARALALNQRFGVGFWLRSDADAFAIHEQHRTGIEHDVSEHPIHGTRRTVFDVAAKTERKAAA
jgi:hypothetical protein